MCGGRTFAACLHLHNERCALPRPPQAPAQYNQWNENEDMIVFYLETLHQQLQQAYVGLALAVSAGRAFILPEVCGASPRGG